MNKLQWKSLAYTAFKLAQQNDVLMWQKMFELLLNQYIRKDDHLSATQLNTLLLDSLVQTRDSFSPEFVDFMITVTKKKCIKQIRNIYYLFSHLLFLCQDSLVVTVETAHQLQQTLKEDIEAKIISYYGISNILIKYQMREDLIGGIRICTPLGIMDHSIKYKLKMMNLEENK